MWQKSTTVSPSPRCWRPKTSVLLNAAKVVVSREGEGLINEGTTTVNSSGGLKSKGHPLGDRTGQVVEVFKQLRGQVESGAPSAMLKQP